MMTTTPYSNVKPGIYTMLEVNPDGFPSSLSDDDSSNGNDGNSVNLQGRQAKKTISMAVNGEV